MLGMGISFYYFLNTKEPSPVFWGIIIIIIIISQFCGVGGLVIIHRRT
jgi:hypothetical protein